MGEILLTTLISMGLMKLMWIALLLLLVWLPSVVYCLRIGRKEGRPILSLFKGLLLGPLGVLLMESSKKVN
ncbi:hypothetical protein [uncultured Shewanella sp.]|uniref:hypothetical protein n=1 Tax=uncultured Shewanella sp. TaxID=173975 RepID=UPI00262BBD01|nr:hypothetical protein [uncultured Shewanella sp.]